jgi:hypothetical protein
MLKFESRLLETIAMEIMSKSGWNTLKRRKD